MRKRSLKQFSVPKLSGQSMNELAPATDSNHTNAASMDEQSEIETSL